MAANLENRKEKIRVRNKGKLARIVKGYRNEDERKVAVVVLLPLFFVMLAATLALAGYMIATGQLILPIG